MWSFGAKRMKVDKESLPKNVRSSKLEAVLLEGSADRLDFFFLVL